MLSRFIAMNHSPKFIVHKETRLDANQKTKHQIHEKIHQSCNYRCLFHAPYSSQMTSFSWKTCAKNRYTTEKNNPQVRYLCMAYELRTTTAKKLWNQNQKVFFIKRLALKLKTHYPKDNQISEIWEWKKSLVHDTGML